MAVVICLHMAKIIQSIKIRIYPNNQQAEYFSKIFGCCRFVYNKCLEYKQNVFNKTGKLHLFWDLMKLYIQNSKECEARILKLNPTPEALIKALFLSLELEGVMLRTFSPIP